MSAKGHNGVSVKERETRQEEKARTADFRAQMADLVYSRSEAKEYAGTRRAPAQKFSREGSVRL